MMPFDRFTERAQDVIEAMAGAVLRDRELELELAKSG